MIFLVVCPEPDCPVGKDRPRDEYPDRPGAEAFVRRHAFTGHRADIQEEQ